MNREELKKLADEANLAGDACIVADRSYLLKFIVEEITKAANEGFYHTQFRFMDLYCLPGVKTVCFRRADILEERLTADMRILASDLGLEFSVRVAHELDCPTYRSLYTFRWT